MIGEKRQVDTTCGKIYDNIHNNPVFSSICLKWEENHHNLQNVPVISSRGSSR